MKAWEDNITDIYSGNEGNSFSFMVYALKYLFFVQSQHSFVHLPGNKLPLQEIHNCKEEPFLMFDS